MSALASRPIFETRATTRPRIALAAVATWFALGCIALLVMPGLRGSDPWLGWMPFWLVGVPAIEWALLRLSCRKRDASTGAKYPRPRRARAARRTSSRRIRTQAGIAGSARISHLLTALSLRSV